MSRLSKENVEKICMTGLYKHEPDVKYRGELFANQLYHCFNWTFTVYHNEKEDRWFMIDTYFGNKSIELTNKNFDEFEFIFDRNEVELHSGNNIKDYNECDYWRIAVDSGGWKFAKWFLRIGATKNEDKVLQRLAAEIDNMEQSLWSKKQHYEMVRSGNIPLEYA